MINNAAKLQNKIYYANKIAKIFITDIVLKKGLLFIIYNIVK